MQTQRYPLPPLFLTEILDDYRSLRHAQDVTVVKIEEGHGYHTHDDPDDQDGCGWYDDERYDGHMYVTVRRRKPFGCMRDCDDSDWVVTLEYTATDGCWPDDGRRYQAVYGVKRHGDIQRFSLWAD